MDLQRHTESLENLELQFSRLESGLSDLSKEILEARKPPSGPYRLFHEMADAITRHRNLRLILRRLYRERVELLKSDTLVHMQRPANWPAGTPYPDWFSALTKEQHERGEEITVDFQSMIIFAGILLDDLAKIGAHILGAPHAYRIGFDALAKSDGRAPFENLWAIFSPSILWLDAIPRLFRNKMLVHREQPWQVGSTHPVFQLDWSFFVPIAANWLRAEEITELRAEIGALLGKIGESVVPDAPPYSSIYVALDHIHRFGIEDRRRIHALAANTGFGTPSFHEFGRRLYEFATAYVDWLRAQAAGHPERIDLGSRQNSGRGGQ